MLLSIILMAGLLSVFMTFCLRNYRISPPTRGTMNIADVLVLLSAYYPIGEFEALVFKCERKQTAGKNIRFSCFFLL